MEITNPESVGNLAGKWKLGKIEEDLGKFFVKNTEEEEAENENTKVKMVIIPKLNEEELEKYYTGNIRDLNHILADIKDPFEKAIYELGFYNCLYKRNTKYEGLADNENIEDNEKLKRSLSGIKNWVLSGKLIKDNEGNIEDITLTIVLFRRLQRNTVKRRLKKIEETGKSAKELGEMGVLNLK